MCCRWIAPVFLLFLLLSGCPNQHRTKEELLSQGIRLMQETKPGAATVLLKKALEMDPNYFEARLQLAKAYSVLGNFSAAEKELEKVRRQNPSSREVKIEIARLMAHTKRPDEALKEIAEYVRDGDADCDALQVAGFSHATKQDYPVAVMLLNRAVTACGADSTLPALLLASVYTKTGRIGQAETELNRIMQKEPENRKPLYMLAEIQVARKDRAGALKTYDRILEIQPNDIEARYRKGMLFLNNDNHDNALALAHELTTNAPNRHEGHRLLGFALFFKKQYNEAIAPLQKSLAMQPNAGTYYILGLTHAARRETEQAMNQFQKALDLQPSLTTARLQLAQVLLNRGRSDDAIKEANKALAEENENAYAHTILGSAYLAKGEYSEGMAELNLAIRLDPSLADAHMKKGLVALKRGMGQEAESELAAVIRLKPEAQDARRLLALEYINRNRPAKAIEVLQKGIQGDASDAILYYLMGEACLRDSRESEAGIYYRKAKEADPGHYPAYQRIAAGYFKQGKQEQAVQELRSLLGHSPDNAEVLLLLASLGEIDGNETEARSMFLRAAGTGKPQAVVAAAHYLWRTNDVKAALKTVNEAMKRSSADPDLSLYELKGKLLSAEKKYREALTAFETVERRSPQIGFGPVINTYLALGEYDKAVEKVESAIRKNPTEMSLRAELSRVLFRKGDRQKAIETAEEIIRKIPDSPVGYLALALIHQGSRDIDAAIQVLNRGAKIQDSNLSIMLSSLYASKKEYAAALAECSRVQHKKKGADQVLFQKATILHMMGRKKEAEAEYQNVLHRWPNHFMALNNLAYLYADANRNMPQAMLYATRAFMLAPAHDSIRDTLAYVLVRNGRAGQGLQILTKLAERNPKNPTMHYHLALAYEASGRPEQAAESLQKALSLDDFTEADMARQLLHKIKAKAS